MAHGPKGRGKSLPIQNFARRTKRQAQPAQTTSNKRMCLDSGATATFLSNTHAHFLQNPRPVVRKIITADGRGQTATTAGHVELPTEHGKISLSDVVVCPWFPESLLSCSQLVDNGHSVHLETGNSYVGTPTGASIPITHERGTFYLDLIDEMDHARVAQTKKSDLEILQLWHARLADTSYRTINKMIRNKLAKGLPDRLSVKQPKSYCPICAQSKLRKRARDNGLGTVVQRTKRDVPSTKQSYLVGECWSSDLFGPVVMSSGKKFWVWLGVERLCRYTWGVIIYDKHSQTLITAIQTICTNILVPLRKEMRRMHTDNALEMKSAEMIAFLLKEGITRTHSAEYDASRNGICERRIGVINIKIVALCLRANPINDAWYPKIVKHAIYLSNVVPPAHGAQAKSPHQQLHNQIPDLSDLRVFGSPVYFLTIPQPANSRFKPKAKLGRIVGVLNDRDGYDIATAESNYRSFVASAHVRVIEKVDNSIPGIVHDVTTHASGSLPILHVEEQPLSTEGLPQSYMPPVPLPHAMPSTTTPSITTSTAQAPQHVPNPANDVMPVTAETIEPQPTKVNRSGLTGKYWSTPTTGRRQVGTTLKFPISLYNEVYGVTENANRTFFIPQDGHLVIEEKLYARHASIAEDDCDEFQYPSALMANCEQMLADAFCDTLTVAFDDAHYVHYEHDGKSITCITEHDRARAANGAILPPKDYAEAIQDSRWMQSIRREWGGIVANKTFGPEELLPEGEIGIPLRYQFTVKTNQSGDVVTLNGEPTGLKTRIYVNTTLITRTAHATPLMRCTSCPCTRKDVLSLFERICTPDIHTTVTDLTGQSCRVKRNHAGPQLTTIAKHPPQLPNQI